MLRDGRGTPELILIATGSEVPLAVEAWEALAADGVQARVVSMPSVDVFEAQDAEYRDAVLPPTVERRLAIEAGLADYWLRFTGLRGRVVGMRGFGESAPAEALFRHFGFTVDNVLEQARALLARDS